MEDEQRINFGPLTLQRHREFMHRGIFLHVLHHGVDITRICTYADDTPELNHADVLKLNAEGKPYADLETGGVVKET